MRILFCIAMVFLAGQAFAQKTDNTGKPVQGFPFYVYTDGFSRSNHYVPSGWMGDAVDMKFTDKWASNQQSGTTCIRIVYSAKRSQGHGWAGIYWQDPANNWGEQKGGYNLTGATNLSFWARGEKGGEMMEIKYGGINGDYSDSSQGASGPLSLGREWKKYSVKLEGDLSRIIGGLCVVVSQDKNWGGITFYLDEIAYEGPVMTTGTNAGPTNAAATNR